MSEDAMTAENSQEEKFVFDACESEMPHPVRKKRDKDGAPS